MSLQEKEVQGQALYLEFRKNYATIQVIITPDGFDEGNNLVRASFFRRMLTKDQPKKRWKTYGLRANSLVEALKDETALEEVVVAEATAQRALNLYDFMESLVRGGYKLVSDKPIYVEVSKEDFTAISKMDTPTKVINRIKSARSALNFPEEVVNTPSA